MFAANRELDRSARAINTNSTVTRRDEAMFISRTHEGARVSKSVNLRILFGNIVYD